MGNASVTLVNKSEIPIVWVLSHIGPLFWGVLQPGESVTQTTGKVWFNIAVYPFDGKNEPTAKDRLMGILIPTAAALAVTVTAGAAAVAAIPVAGTAAAALAPIATGPSAAFATAASSAAAEAVATSSSVRKFLIKDARDEKHAVALKYWYANGRTIVVTGNVAAKDKGKNSNGTSGLRFEYLDGKPISSSSSYFFF